MPTIKRRLRTRNNADIEAMENIIFLHAQGGSLDKNVLLNKLVNLGYDLTDAATAYNNLVNRGKFGQSFEEV